MTGGEIFSAVLQLVLSLLGAGVLVQLLLLRQNRRKIAGDASVAEASAVSTLSDAALKMVTNEQEQRAKAEVRLVELQARVDDYETREVDQRWTVYRASQRERQLEEVIRAAGLVVPPPHSDQELGIPPQVRVLPLPTGPPTGSTTPPAGPPATM